MPLRQLLLAILAAFGVLIAAGQFAFLLHTFNEEALARMTAVARHSAGSLAANIGAELGDGDREHVSRLVHQKVTQPDLIYAAFVGADGRVQASTPIDLTGAQIVAQTFYPAPPADLLGEMRRTAGGLVRQENAGHVLWSVFPVKTASAGDDPAQAAYVIIALDTSAIERTALQSALSQGALVLVPLLLLSLGVAVLVKFLLTDRVEQLLAYARSQAEGGHSPPAVTGSDELGQLGARLATLMQTLVESRDYHVRLLDRMPNPIWRTDASGKCDYFNQAWLTFTGRTLEEELEDCAGGVHPDDRERRAAAFERAFEAREAFAIEYRLRFNDGSYHCLHDHGEPFHGGDGSFLGFVGSAFDVQADKEAEEEIRRLNTELEARVEQRTVQLAALNKELETFAYSVSHDLKAPLRGIDGYSHLLLEDHAAELDEEGRLFLGNIRSGVKQMARLIDDLLAYSRVERRNLQKVEVKLAEMVRGVLAERAAALGNETARIELDMPDLVVLADPEGLAQVLRNLIDNALKYSRDANPPEIRIGAREHAGVTHIWVQDNGIGFDMKFHDRIFEIFQRLQRAEDYAGTGVGLAIVRKAMQRMDGRIWADSTPGHGATFHLELPR